LNIEIIIEFCISFNYWKLQSKYNKNSMFYWNEIKQQNKIYGISKTKSRVFSYKERTSISLLQNYVFKNEYPFLKTLIFG
jgi:hypothetical protein